MRLVIGLTVLGVAILATGIVPLATQGDGVLPEDITIQTDIDAYIPLMSSTVGIGLIPVYELESPLETVQLHWRTDYGYLVAWDSPDFKVNLLGTEVINDGQKVYWSYDPGEMGVEKPTVEISVQVEDARSGQVLAEGSLKIGWEDKDTARVISHTSGQEDGFVISLTDSGEIVLSEHEIQAYHSDDNAFILNENGIKKWNSFLTYQTIPKLADSLFSREFALKIEGQEICKGKFWSFASSTSHSGVVILDSLFKLDTEHNTLWIKSFSMSSNMSLDAAISSELNSFFEKRNLQK